jgi:hypothetical protein
MCSKRKRCEFSDPANDLKLELIAKYSSLPRTGLYDISLSPSEQCSIFLNYVKYLNQQLYDGPRNIETRRLTELAKEIAFKFPCETERLCELLNISFKNIDFSIMIDRYKQESLVENAGENYKEYMRYYNKANRNPYTVDMIYKIRINLMKKFDHKKVNKKIDTILSEHQASQVKNSALADKFKLLMQTDPKYIKWNEIQTLWCHLGFDKLLDIFHDVITMLKQRKRNNGSTLETSCVNKIVEIVSERTHIDSKELTVLRNVYYTLNQSHMSRGYVKCSKTQLGEIDIMITHKNNIIALIEVKSGIYDIPYAISQIEKLKLYINNTDVIFNVDRNKVSVQVSESILPIYLVVTGSSYKLDSVSSKILMTGASFSDVHLITDAFFNDPENTLINIIEKESYGQEDIVKVNEIINNIRTKMKCKIDLQEAIRILSDNLIVI